ncbi:MAG: Holliday junction resolvase RuvX [Flavobacteriales bacterium]|nr:Holliday junction resolvase RuvX [Flavobacteriales bacterium]
MPKAIALDYGKKRVGIAETDDLQIVASGLTTVETNHLIPFLDDYIKQNIVEVMVIGESKTLNNEYNEIEKDIIQLIKKLNNRFSELKIKRIDERFTSKIASYAISQSGMNKKKRQNKALIDEISATLILQSYLEQKTYF